MFVSPSIFFSKYEFSFHILMDDLPVPLQSLHGDDGVQTGFLKLGITAKLAGLFPTVGAVLCA